MAFQSLYRRYRPQRFGEVLGQDHVTCTLRNAVRTASPAHFYLFSGPRGTGKTSTARILAKALNCTAPEDGEPCGRCPSCVDIAEGRSLDVVELDAASNRGIDAMRDLVARVALGTAGRWKVYIVDEVHMLTTEAANTLLKTLEEPPAHVVFILATTEPQKVLQTIRSRAQCFEFRLFPASLLVELLTSVAADAGLDVAPEAISLVARRGNGSARDALSVLDQVAAAGGVDQEPPGTDELLEALVERDAGQALLFVAQRCGAGHDPRQLARDALEHLRQAFLVTMSRALVSLPDDDLAKVEAQGRRLGPAAAVRAMEVLGEMLVAMRDAPDPRVLLEVALVRLCRPEADVSAAALLERLERLEQVVAALGRAAPAVPRRVDDPGGSQLDAERTDTAPPPTGPAAGARQALGGPRRTPPPPSPDSPRRSPPPPPPPVPGEPAPPAASPAAGEADSPRASVPFPTRDELTLAWADKVLGAMGRRAAVRFQVGRFLSADDGVAVFALPNGVHRDRCEEVRADAEAALAAHFGRPVPLCLVVDGQPAVAPGPAPDEEVDLHDLRDAPAGEVTSPLDHVMSAFEGAQVVEE
ncbi:MAG: DNA polymerase III subunit gamma/tau [Acidimicrobiales bacterium]